MSGDDHLEQPLVYLRPHHGDGIRFRQATKLRRMNISPPTTESSEVANTTLLGDVACVLAAFLLSRALFSIAVLLAAALSVMPKNEAILFSDVAGKIDVLARTAYYTDSSWYLRVITEGYPWTTDYLTTQTTLVFFPVSPLLSGCSAAAFPRALWCLRSPRSSDC